MTARAWTTRELATLRRLAGTMPPDEIGAILGRTPKAVEIAAQRHRISLRREGERRGLILGQPRGVSFAAMRALTGRLRELPAIREAVLAGTTDPAELERIARRASRLAAGAPICPVCVERPQEMAHTGLCTECHLEALTDAHRADEALRERRRAYDREKQARHRRKDQPA